MRVLQSDKNVTLQIDVLQPHLLLAKSTVAAYNKVEDVPGQGTLAVLTVARGLGQHACRILF